MNVLLISDAQVYLMTNIVNQLKEHDFSVFQANLKVQSIYDNMHEPEAILVYVDEDYEAHLQEYLFIRDKALELSCPVFLMGTETDMEGLTKHISNCKIPQKFARPIDVKGLAKTVADYLEAHSRQNKKSILVVDDSGAVLRNVKGWLEDKYQITLANSGTTAIKSLSLKKPDLVLLDYEMPVIDGAQVLEMIRSEEDFKDIPVIFLTSKGDREHVMKVMALKPEGYLLKTLPPSEIIAQIDLFFEKQLLKEL